MAKIDRDRDYSYPDPVYGDALLRKFRAENPKRSGYDSCGTYGAWILLLALACFVLGRCTAGG